jgi:hypothetical protein
LLSRGSRLVVFDTRTDTFTVEPPELPRHLVLGACCGIEILDTQTRQVTTMPGPLASSGFDVTVSSCGRFGWIDLLPEADDIGIFSIERQERVFQPWPHPTLGMPTSRGSVGEGHDDVVRALAACDDGTFRILYGRHVLDAAHAHALDREPRVAAFDPTGERLVTLDDQALEVHTLDANARPRLVTRWSCAALTDHLAPALPVVEAGLELGELMATVGTTRALTRLRADELADRLHLETDAVPQLESLIRAARTMSPRTRLERLDARG